MASHGVARPATTVVQTEQEKAEEREQISQYRELEDLIRTKIAERQYTVEVLELTSKLLKKNPEYYTIWNVRKRLLIYGLFSKSLDSSSPSTELPTSSQTDIPSTSSVKPSSSSTITSEVSSTTPPNPTPQNRGKIGTTLDKIQADLDFLFPLMIKYPKCYWLWNYRLWLLQEANHRLAADVARGLWTRELGLVGKMLVKDSRNFHGWGYRRKVVSELESARLNGMSMVESEFEYTTKMIHGDKGLSNFSAWHIRSKLIPRLLSEREADHATRKKFLDDDSYPYAQSAWFYYQFLMTTLTDVVGHATISPSFTPTERSEYVIQQLATLREMLDGAEDCKWIYNALIEYTVALAHMRGQNLNSPEKENCKAWLAELRMLDPMRAGRWDDLGMKLDNEES